MMTPEEIKSAEVTLGQDNLFAAVYRQAGRKALSSLTEAYAEIARLEKLALTGDEEAHREIARLEKLALTGDSGYCSGCERVLPSAEISFTDEQHYCSPCLAEATKPRLAAATMRVQGEGESLEVFLARRDLRESTT